MNTKWKIAVVAGLAFAAFSGLGLARGWLTWDQIKEAAQWLERVALFFV